MINLELYRIFYTVAKAGSLTKAAKQLYISQPAVSQAIKQLENELGGKLFNRTHSGITLTEVGGVQVFQIVEKALKLLDSAQLKYSELKTTATGLVRVGASDLVMTKYLLKYVKEYHKRYPNVNLSLINGITGDIINKLLDKRLDIGVINLPIDDSRVTLLTGGLHLHDTFVAGSRFKELTYGITPLNRLQDYPLLMLDLSTTTRQSIINFAHSLGIHLHPEIECSGLDMMVELAKSNVGIACVPREFVEEELKNGELFEIRTEPTLPSRSMGLVIDKDETMTFAVKEFLGMLEEGV